MMSNWLQARPRAPQRLLATAFTVALAATFTACGGGDSGGYTPNAVSQSDRRALPESMMTRASINYSPYRTSRNETELGKEVITPANVLQDLRLIQATGIGSIRLFSSRAFARTVLEVIRDNNLDLKVQLGTYPNPITGLAAEADNIAELDAGIALANAFPTIVVAVSVGNETMVEWSTHKVPVADMARYIKRVRSAIKQPVTTNDNFLFWASVPPAIAEVVDYAAVHTYPFLDTFYNPSAWDWRQKNASAEQRAQTMINASIAEAKSQFELARQGLASLNLGHLPMVIGETGWAAVDTPGGPTLNLRAHPVNQKMYFDALQTWAQEGRRDVQGPKAIFLFQAFDEPWKQGDDGWGLFNKDRQARYAVKSLGTCGVTWTCEPEPQPYTAASAVKWALPTLTDAVTANRYTLYSEAVVAGETRGTGLRWEQFDATAGFAEVAGGAPNDGSVSFEITPKPANYGWGAFFFSDTGVTANLKPFEGGRLNFAVKSDSYPGKIEVGFSTDTDDRDGQEVFLQIGPGEYGYCNTNQWCQVSIPVSAFLAANPKLDLRYVGSRIIIADRFSFTGKPLIKPDDPAVQWPKIRVDGIHWSK
jgi:exo-beta-1,3-glucanase (GH17 family)